MQIVEKKCPHCESTNYFPNPPMHTEHRCLGCGAVIYPDSD